MSTMERALGLQKPEQLALSLKTYVASYEQWFIQQMNEDIQKHLYYIPDFGRCMSWGVGSIMPSARLLRTLLAPVIPQ